MFHFFHISTYILTWSNEKEHDMDMHEDANTQIIDLLDAQFQVLWPNSIFIPLEHKWRISSRAGMIWKSLEFQIFSKEAPKFQALHFLYPKSFQNQSLLFSLQIKIPHQILKIYPNTNPRIFSNLDFLEGYPMMRGQSIAQNRLWSANEIRNQ